MTVKERCKQQNPFLDCAANYSGGKLKADHFVILDGSTGKEASGKRISEKAAWESAWERIRAERRKRDKS